MGYKRERGKELLGYLEAIFDDGTIHAVGLILLTHTGKKSYNRATNEVINIPGNAYDLFAEINKIIEKHEPLTIGDLKLKNKTKL